MEALYNVVIGKDGKTVVIKHGGLWKNVTKIYITMIQDRNEEKEDEVRRLSCSKAVDEEKDNWKRGYKRKATVKRILK